TSSGGSSCVSRLMIRSTSTAVFPEPAAADTRILRPRRSMTFCCSLVHFTLTDPHLRSSSSPPTSSPPHHPLNISPVSGICSRQCAGQIRRYPGRRSSRTRSHPSSDRARPVPSPHRYPHGSVSPFLRHRPAPTGILPPEGFANFY